MAVWSPGTPEKQVVYGAMLAEWVASLLPPDVRYRAFAELGDLLAAAADAHPRTHRPRRTDPAAGAEDRIAALRAAGTVLSCDAILAAVPPDWPALAAAHGGEPFGRAQRRALIARDDCPEDITDALLTPWDPRVAGRLVVRRGEPPARAWWPGLSRIGELRPALLREVLTERNAAGIVSAATRLDLLIRAYDGYDHNHQRQLLWFWEAVGTALRASLGDDREAWLTVARRLSGHRGSLRGLLRGLGRPAAGSASDTFDLRVLALAPPEVLADLVARFDDSALAAAAEPVLRQRARSHLLHLVLDRLQQAGVPPREPFARWAYSTHARTPTVCAWLYGLHGGLDDATDDSAHHHEGLRRLLARRTPARPLATDPITALRRCGGPVEAQAVLDAAYGERAAPPWPELVDAHDAEPLPGPVLCVLAARPGFPDALAAALPPTHLFRLSAGSPAAARTALANLGSPAVPGIVIGQVRSAGVLDDRAVLAAIRPAREALSHGRALASGTASRDRWAGLCADLAHDAAAGAAPGFWRRLAELLPTFDGSLPEVLAAARPAPQTR
ncbi:hypothetical protein [Kitasatospora sp. NPDC088346]|uniref:hypothetical protein n=1 Tax=Kitasatospora sp. NPDC088346 TaxID=3364073 RepID=UPI003828A487